MGYDIFEIRKHIFNEILDIAFPSTCCFCSKIVAGEYPIKGICRKCLTRIPMRDKDFLKISCIDKNLKDHPLNNSPANIPVLVACRYEDPVKKALLDLKFYEASFYREFFGSLLAFVFSGEIKKYDCIVPIPLHKSRMKERGYNQSWLIADKISHITGVPTYDDVLVRQKYTQRQSEMKTESDRAGNVSDVFFCVKPEKLINQKILILDDVLTSGSTMCYAADTIINSIKTYDFKKNKFSEMIEKNDYKYNECCNNISLAGIVAASGRSC